MNWITLSQLIFFVEILGTIAFSLSGAIVAIRKKMDILGVIVLGVTTAVGGGIVRDLLLGHTPPAAFQNSIYVLWAAGTAIATFFLYYESSVAWIDAHKKFFDNFLNFVDALGLGIFAAIGVRTAVEGGYADNTFLSLFVGTLTGVGGGTLRDMFAGEVPTIFRKHIYAVAALLGAVIYYLLHLNHEIPESAAIFMSVSVVVSLRMLAAYYLWNLPTAK